MAEDRKKITIGHVDVPPQYASWLKHVNKDGDVIVMEPGGAKRDPKTQGAVEKAVGAVRARFVAKGKQLRNAVSSARDALKKDLRNDTLREQFDKAERELSEFNASRAKALAQEVRAAREKALGK